MPVDRALAEDLATTLADLYSQAATRIAEGLARDLKTGIASPNWVHDKLGSLGDLRNAVRQLLVRLDTDTTGAAHQAVVLAFARGGTAALDELTKAGMLTPQQVAAIKQSVPNTAAINRLVWSLVSTLRGTHLRVLRWTLDAYREVVTKTAAVPVLLGTKARLAAAQTAWEELLARGITGFVDRSGRRWQLASYVEMATRTVVAQAAVEGHLDRLADQGIDLVIVSDALQECVKCRPWEGKVLHRAGGSRGLVHVPHATEDGVTVTLHVAGSVDEAIAKGLLHPNCRHALSAYLPGVTKLGDPRKTPDPEGDQARQRLRQLERNVRTAKTQAAAALTPDAAATARARVRAIQAQIRDHLANHPDLMRQPHREQIGTAR